jgi:hypothetical protein
MRNRRKIIHTIKLDPNVLNLSRGVALKFFPTILYGPIGVLGSNEGEQMRSSSVCCLRITMLGELEERASLRGDSDLSSLHGVGDGGTTALNIF